MSTNETNVTDAAINGTIGPINQTLPVGPIGGNSSSVTGNQSETQRFFTVGLALFMTFNFVLWPSMILFIKRQHFYPVSNRFPGQVIVQNILLLVRTYSLCIRIMISSVYPCGLVVWLEDTTQIAVSVLFAVRIMSLWVRYKVVGQRSSSFWSSGLIDSLKKISLDLKRKSVFMSQSSMSMSSSSVSDSEDDIFVSQSPARTLSGSPPSPVESELADGPQRSWVSDKTWLIEPWFLSMFTLGVLLLFYIPFVYFSVSIPSMMTADLYTCARNNTITYVLSAEWILMLIVLIVLASKWMPEVKEALGMKTEIALVLPIGCGVMIMGTMIATVPSFIEINRKVFPVFSFVHAIANTVIVVISTLIPALRSYPHIDKWLESKSHCVSRARPAHSETSIELGGEDVNVNGRKYTLDEVLADVTSTNFFRRFLEKEFAMENLIFYCEALDWRTKAERQDSDIEVVAIDIAKRFLLPGSRMEVNLPRRILDLPPLKQFLSDLRPVAPSYGLIASLITRSPLDMAATESSVQNALYVQGRVLSPELFEAARRHVFHLMESDSYRRFVQSEDYNEMAKVRRRVLKKRTSKYGVGPSSFRILKSHMVPLPSQLECS